MVISNEDPEDRTYSFSNSDPDPSQFTYMDLLAVSNAYNEKNDCAVTATCVVTNNPYPVIHELFRKFGRRRRCATHNVTLFAVLNELGYRLHDVTMSYPGRTVRAVTPQLPKQDAFLVMTARHVLGVVNSKAEDWSHERGLFVQSVMQVLATYEPTPDLILKTDSTRGRWNGNVTAQAAIRALAAQEYKGSLRAGEVAPFAKRWWLALRARVMAKAEGHGIKRTTASIELGKWQAEMGYDMKLLR